MSVNLKIPIICGWGIGSEWGKSMFIVIADVDITDNEEHYKMNKYIH